MRKSQQLSEGALISALTMILALLNQYSGFLIDAAIPWLYAFPMLLYAARNGLRWALIALGSICLLSLAFLPWTSFFYLLSSLLLGLVYGSCVQHKVSNACLLFFSFLIAFTVNMITTLLLAGLFGYDLTADIALIDAFLQNKMAAWLPQAQSILFFSIVFLSVLQSLIIHAGAQMLLKRLHIKTIPMKNLLQIRAPRSLGIAILLIWLLYLLQIVIELQVETQWLIECLAMGAWLIAVIYGAICAFAYLALHQVRKITMVFVYLALFVPIVNIAFVLLGEADLLFGLRKAMM